MSAYWTSGNKTVSDLYVYKQYRQALRRIDELENMLINPPVNFDEIEQELFLQGVR
jgi:hypothetical protein